MMTGWIKLEFDKDNDSKEFAVKYVRDGLCENHVFLVPHVCCSQHFAVLVSVIIS